MTRRQLHDRKIVIFIQAVFLSSLFLATHGSFGEENKTVPVFSLFESTFSVSLPYENPYDASDIQADAEIGMVNGSPASVPCFFDGESWIFRYTPSKPGTYTYRIRVKNATKTEEIRTDSFHATEREAKGFLRTGSNSSRHFVFDNGESYFALGENLGWVQWSNTPQIENWTGYLDECAQAGINWIRIWMCPWGMTELTWTPRNGRYFGYNKYDMVNARVIDGIFQEAEKRGIYIQWVINHHGQYSKDTNPEWQNNPFNVKNGGFLNEPWEFFTNDEAKRHYRNRLRYLVARWGYSTSLLAWEFWNEVNLTSKYDFPTVKQWHEEMIGFLRGIDPYSHLLTTSTSGDYSSSCAIEGLDFLQSHSYTNNLIDKLKLTSERNVRDCPQVPHLFGEMAYDWRGPAKIDPTGISLHNQLWASVHATSDAGTAMTWWWDNWVRPQNLYPHFRALANYLEGIDWANEELIPLELQIESNDENRGPFYFIPQIGWGTTKRTRFEIKESGTVEGLDECSQFIHGNAHRDMAPNPIFLVNFSRTIEMNFQIAEVAKNGAHCTVSIDGKEVLQRAFAPTQNDSTMGEDGLISFSVPSGRHNVSIKNTGPDWFKVKYYSIDGLVQRSGSFARGNDDRVLLWVYDRLHQLVYLTDSPDITPISAASVTLPNLSKGEYVIDSFDTYAGEYDSSRVIRASEKGLVIPIPSYTKDRAFHIRRKLAAVDAPLR